MNHTLRFALTCATCAILFLPAGCKKKADEKPDYSCDCAKYGKNLATFLLDNPLSLIPYYDAAKKWGFMDVAGKVVIPPKYAMAYRFSGNRALIVDNSSGREFVGFVDPEGAMAIPPSFTFIASYFPKEGLLPVGNLQNWKIGYIDRSGNVVIPYQYALVYGFHDGYATVGNGSHEGVIDVKGNEIIPMVYNRVGMFSEGLAYVNTAGGKHGYIDNTNRLVIDGTFTEGGWFIDGLAWVNDPITHLYGFIRPDGSYQVQPQFQDVGNFWENFAAAKLNGKWGFINKTGLVRIPCQFSDIAGGFSEGLAAVEKSGKWGYIDATGAYKISPEFDDADVFICGIAMVFYSDGSYGFINRNGTSVWRSAQGSLKSGSPIPEKLSGHEYRPCQQTLN